MENKEKYYTPDISNLHVGYKCEIYNSNSEWFPITITSGHIFNDLLFYTRDISKDLKHLFRTPYLTKQDIESLGWVYNGIDKFYTDCEVFQLNTVDKDNNYLNYFMKISFKDRWLQIEEMGSDTLFQGECKSINELRKVMNFTKIIF